MYKCDVDEDINDGDENYCDDGRSCKILLWLVNLAHHLRPGELARKKALLQCECLYLRRKAVHNH